MENKTLTPYEEVLDVMERLKHLKMTLDSTDIEYFDANHLVEFIALSNETKLSAMKIRDCLKNEIK